VYLASGDVVTPSCLEIMTKVKEATIPEIDLEFAQITNGLDLPPNATVFAMGGYTRVGNERVVPAPSVAQTMTKPDILTRMGTAFRLLVDPPELPEFEYTVVDDVSAAIEFLTETVDQPKVVIDIETSGVIAEDEHHPRRIISFAFCAGGMNYVFTEEVCQSSFWYAAMCMFMERNGIIAVNGKFDLSYFPDTKVRFIRDTQLAHYALFPAAGQHDLKNTAKKYFGFEDWDAGLEEYLPSKTYETYEKFPDGSWHDARHYPRKNGKGSGYERIPRDLLYRYNAFDVYATWHWDVLMEAYLADDEDAQRVHALLLELSNMFMGVERRGIRLDIPYMEELSGTLAIEKAEAEAKLNEIAEQKVNSASPLQVKNWLISHGVHLKGTGVDVLKDFMESEEVDSQETEFASQVLVCRDYTKQLGTYVDGYRMQADAKGIVRPGYKLSTSTTGRLGGQGASMLTLPRKKHLKKMVLAYQDNHRVVGADLSQAELRVMACESMDEWLIAAFQPGAPDFFDLLLTEAYPKRDWFELHHRVDVTHTASEAEANLYNGARANMKGVVYGVSFNRGVPAIARALKIPIYESQQLVNAFVRPGSMFAMWREEIIDKAVDGEAIVTKFGRHFQSELITRKNKHLVINSALAFTSQSTANDICLTAALAVDAQLPAYGAHLMGTIHDAIYTSTPFEEVDLVGELLVRELHKAGQAVYGDLVPFDASWGSGKNLAEV
jgi:DNA polymerase I-like protein with 3'-5' exonuclease and polymerase domains